ncbi:MAG: hypothetical protein GF364_02780 [Candidatus Lokiarchaeota archaeon]|nr:hypothetical protein [Candidatus Lokiarchaeota archaeon]
MSEQWINNAIETVELQIDALKNEDFNAFKSLFTPRIQKEVLTYELFDDAFLLFQKYPLKK